MTNKYESIRTEQYIAMLQGSVKLLWDNVDDYCGYHQKIHKINILINIIGDYELYKKLYSLGIEEITRFHRYVVSLNDLYLIGTLMQYTTHSTTLHLELIFNNLYEQTIPTYQRYTDVLKEVL